MAKAARKAAAQIRSPKVALCRLHLAEILEMTDTDKAAGELYELTFYVQRCIRYHMRRTAFFMRWGRFTAFVGVISGSATVTSLLTHAPTYVVTISALLVTVASATDLVVGTGQRAWLHNDLRKRYLDIEAEVLACARPIPDDLMRQLKSRIRRIEADEPPTLPALELLARDDVIRSLYTKEEAAAYLCKLSWFKRTTAHWFDWDTSEA